MTRAQKRIDEIRRLCTKRAHAERLSRRKEMARIDTKLQPLMVAQLEYELRQDKCKQAVGA